VRLAVRAGSGGNRAASALDRSRVAVVEDASRPAYQITLEGYRQALARFEQRPSLATRAFWVRWLQRLEAHLEQPDGIALGGISWTDAAEDAFERGMHHPGEFLLRHKYGDHGDITERDRQMNRRSRAHRGWIVSRYETRTAETVWVVTVPDWTATRLAMHGEE
jgi:hypothetical protein